MTNSDAILELYSRRPADLTDEDIDAIIADQRQRLHSYNTTAKSDAGKKPKRATSATGKAAEKLASETLFDL